MPTDHAYDSYADASRRILAVLDDLQQVRPAGRYHWDGCWQDHVACLAARVRATLTGEDTTDAAAR